MAVVIFFITSPSAREFVGLIAATSTNRVYYDIAGKLTRSNSENESLISKETTSFVISSR